MVYEVETNCLLEFKDPKLEKMYWTHIIERRASFYFKLSIAVGISVISLNVLDVIISERVEEHQTSFHTALYLFEAIILCYVVSALNLILVAKKSFYIRMTLPLEFFLLRLFHNRVIYSSFKAYLSNNHMTLLTTMFCILSMPWKYYIIFGGITMFQDYALFFITGDIQKWQFDVLECLISDIPFFIFISVIGWQVERKSRGSYIKGLKITQLEDIIAEKNAECRSLLDNLVPRKIASRLEQALEESLRTGVDFSELAMSKCVETHNDSTIIFILLTRKDGREIMKDISLIESIEHCAYLFRAFDDAVEKKGFMKVKTVMNMYVIFKETSNGIKALKLCQSLRKIAMKSGYTLKIGLTINATIITGILGHNRLQWDIFSNDANYAYYLMTLSSDNEISFSEKVNNDLKKRGITTPARESVKVDLKESGSVITYVLPLAGVQDASGLDEMIESSTVSPANSPGYDSSVDSGYSDLRDVEAPLEIETLCYGVATRFKDPQKELEFLDAMATVRFRTNFGGFTVGMVCTVMSLALLWYNDVMTEYIVPTLAFLITYIISLLFLRKDLFINDDKYAMSYEILFRAILLIELVVLSHEERLFRAISMFNFMTNSTLAFTGRDYVYKTVLNVFSILAPVVIFNTSFANGNFQKGFPTQLSEAIAIALLSTLTLINIAELRRHYQAECLEREKLGVQETQEKLLQEMVSYFLPGKLLKGYHNDMPSIIRKSASHEGISPMERGYLLEMFHSATILRVDIVRFTEFCSKNGDVAALEVLNEIYGEFDKICDQHENAIPVSTAGNCYVCLSFNKDNHGTNALRIAIGFMDVMLNYKNEDLSIRIGLESGEVLGGILLSKSRSTYELWGETMICAASLGELSKAGRVHLSKHYMESLGEGTEEYKRVKYMFKTSSREFVMRRESSFMITREQVETILS